MNENQAKPENLLDATDCLEAVGVFRGWKNFLFVVVTCCLLLLQISFWVVNLNLVKTGNETGPPAETDSPVLMEEQAKPADDPETKKAGLTAEAPESDKVRLVAPVDINKIERAAEQVASEPNTPAKAAPKKAGVLPTTRFKHVAWLIRLLNFVLIPAAILYCLTMLFSLKVSLLGRLGGINHISRAFFLSLLMLVLIFPWQRFFFFADILAGVIYMPAELAAWVKWYAGQDHRILAAIPYYLRFTGYWLVAMLLLIFSLLRSTRWAKATLRRLEII